MSSNPTIEPVSPTIDPETGYKNSDETTTRIKTPTSGVIHGTCVEAFRIIAGSEFPVDDTAYVRFSPGDAEDETQFNVSINTDSIDVKNTDVFICGSYTELDPTHNSKRERERVEFQLPYNASMETFSVMNQELPDHYCHYTSYPTPRWNILNDCVDTIVIDTLDLGYSIVTQLGTLRDLYTAHPEYNVSNSGKYIITDDALTDPDYYETDEPTQETRHSKGGNPHDTEYFLENCECPVPDCDAEFDLFRSLKSHVGGKCNFEDETGPHHNLNLRRHEITLNTES